MELDSSHLLIVAMAVAGLYLVMRATRKRSQASQSEPNVSVRERYAELQRTQSASRDLENVMGELDQLARQIHGRLDTKIAKLDGVIRHADDRIDQLSRLLRTANGAPTLDVIVDDAGDSRTPAINTPNSKTQQPKSVENTSDAPDARRLAAKYEVRDQVYALSDDGVSAVQVAQQVGRTTGEVELMLSLRRARHHAAESAGTPPR